MWGAVVLASCSTFAMGGVVFGLSSLYPLLYAQGFYISTCSVEHRAKRCAAVMSTKCCEHQFLRFSLVTSAAFFLVDAAAAPWGELVDRVGGRVCLAWAVSLSVLGFAALSAGAWLRVDALLMIGILALGAAGPGCFNGGFFGTLELIGESSPRAKAALTSLNAAAFDGSALVFMLFHLGSSPQTHPESLASRCVTTLIAIVSLLAACFGRALRRARLLRAGCFLVAPHSRTHLLSLAGGQVGGFGLARASLCWAVGCTIVGAPW